MSKKLVAYFSASGVTKKRRLMKRRKTQSRLYFVTHGTGGLASTIQDITADLPDSEILEPIGVYRPKMDKSKPDVDAWLDSLGFEEAE